MFTDSHTHILMTTKKIENPKDMMSSLKKEGFKFIMDIGTEPGDLKKRIDCVKDISGGNIPSFIHFAAGLWPHSATIENRDEALTMLEQDIKIGLKEARSFATSPIFALGECGLDRYWNGPAAEKRGAGSQADDEKGTTDIEGEEFLFKEQLKIAKEKNLSVIVHSRDAYEDTLKCIDEVGHHKGIIHCYSYGLKEAYSFLERGWFISFPGNITYAKKQADKDRIAELVRAIPADKLLLETDAPYLAPVPFRGKINTPLLIEYTYAAVSEILDKSMEALAEQIYQNCCSCFLVK